MADTVRYLMEAQVPELEDLERRGYFSRSEIKQIAQRRQDFEYALKRKAALRSDFLRYIDYEAKLERLQQHRRKQRGITGKKTLADYCISRRIHFVYERLLRKFRGDLSLWARWLQYCSRAGASRQVSRVVTKALQYHPTAPGLWTFAAAWEFERNLNAAAARALMQQALRMCKHVGALWHEYFRMELLYALRLRERRRTLGIDDAQTGGAGEAAADEAAAAVQSVLSGAVAGLVYRNALVAIPESLPFRAGFLDILRPYEFAGKADLQAAILGSILADFGSDALAWDVLARQHVPPGVWNGPDPWPGVERAIGTYRQGLERAPEAEIVRLLAAFLEEQLGHGLAAAAAEDAQAAVRAAVARTYASLEQVLGERQALADAEVLASQQLLHLHCGHAGKAAEAAQQAVRLQPASAVLQLLLLKLAAAELAGEADATADAGAAASFSSDSDAEGHPGTPQHSQHGIERLQRLVLEAVRVVPADAVPAIWLAGLEAVAGAGGSPVAYGSAFRKWSEGCADVSQAGLRDVAAAIVEAVWTLSGPEAARHLYRSLQRTLLMRGALAHAVLDAETTAFHARGPQALPLRQVLALFEAAVDCDGRHDMALWLKFLRFDQRTSNAPGQVYWRAVKALDEPDPFVELLQLERQ